MDGTFIWMLAGAVMAALGAFLVASEKELRKKRREMATLAAKLSQRSTATVAVDQENNVSRLESTNKDLKEQLAALSSRLESSERELGELESERWRLKNLDTEKRQLQASNQKLHDEITMLREQLNSALKTNDKSEFEKAAVDEQLANLASELKSRTARLEQSQARVEELESAAKTLVLSSAQRSATEARVEFEQNIKTLQRELADSQEKLQAFNTVNRQLLDLEQKHEKALFDNRQLQQEITRWRERLTDSEEKQRRLAIVRQQMDDSRSKYELPDHPVQNQFDNFVGLMEIDSSSRQTAQPAMNLEGTTSPRPSGMNSLEHVYGQASGLDAAREYFEPSRYETEVRIDNDLRHSSDNRTAQLSHLLASIRVHGSSPYQEQIDSLKDLTELSDAERHAVRDIFLARADEAQKRGRDEEMLRYRNWAKNIVYHTPFGSSEEAQGLSENGATANIVATHATTEATFRKTEPANDHPNGIRSAARNVALGIGIGLGLILIVLVQLFFNTSPEITVASDDASTATNSQTAVLPTKQQSLDSFEKKRSATVYGNAAQVEVSRPEDRFRGTVEGAKAAVRNTAKEPDATTKGSQRVWGAYTIVKRTGVYSGPSEDSALITSLDAGTQVNVVAARQGWYEIRSKTGRPPGFVKQEAASRNR